MLHRLWRRGRSIFLVICLLGTNISYALAQIHTPGTSQLGGWVYIDRNNDGAIAWATDPSPEFVIPNVEIKLFSVVGAQETLVATTLTDAFGRYFFNSLAPGTYSIKQTHPTNYMDGQTTVGLFHGLTWPAVEALSAGSQSAQALAAAVEAPPPVPGSGTAGANAFTNIVLPVDVRGDFYNFAELGMAAAAVSKRMFLTTTPPLNSATPPNPPIPGDVIPEPSAIISALVALGWFGLVGRRPRRGRAVADA